MLAQLMARIAEQWSKQAPAWAEATPCTGPFDDTLFESHGIAKPENIVRAADKRRRDFFYGRWCSKQALAQLGPDYVVDVPIAEDRSPIWPPGVLGSITHTQNYAASICGLSNDWCGLGLDAERWIERDSLKALAGEIAIEGELEALGEEWPLSQRLTLSFSAKESLYKTLHPLVGRFFGFQSAALTSFDPQGGRFQIRLCESLSERFAPGHCFEGCLAFNEERVMTLLALPQGF